MMPADLKRFAWVNDDSSQAACVAHIEGASEEIVLTRLNCDIERCESLDFADVLNLQDHHLQRYWIQVVVHEEATILIEPNGFLLSLPEVAAGLSIGTRVVSVFWNDEGMSQFTIADHGSIIRAFDPLLYQYGSSDTSIGVPLPIEAKYSFGGADSSSMAMLAMFEELTGLSLSAAWLYAGRKDTYRTDIAGALADGEPALDLHW